MPVTTETTKLHVAGMTCSGCTSRVTRVDYDPAAVDLNTLKQAIETAGYTAEEK